MSTTIYFSSCNVKHVTGTQLQEALERYDLGQLQTWNMTYYGRMTQTLFIQSSRGQYILKGNPLYEGQWQEEKFFAENIYHHTGLPVPFPYILDEQKDIFGWSYIIMPKLEGMHFHKLLDSTYKQQYQVEWLNILVQALYDLHSWRVNVVGEFNGKKDAYVDLRYEFAQGYDGREVNLPWKIITYKKPVTPFACWIEQRLLYWLQDAERFGNRIGKEGWYYVLEQLTVAMPALERFDTPTMVMGDFKSENLLLDKDILPEDGTIKWKLSGVFDFTTAYFGDPAADLVKILLMLIERKETALAHMWVRNYIELYFAPEKLKMWSDEWEHDFIERLRIHLLHQLILQWGEAIATEQAGFEKCIFTHWIRNKMYILDQIIQRQ